MSHARRRADRDRHPALTSLVIDLIPDQTRAEIEASIDEPLSVEREAVWRDRENAEFHSLTVGTVGAGKSFNTKTELLAGIREDSESGSHTASDSDSGGNHD
jgi:hypothetical protein